MNGGRSERGSIESRLFKAFGLVVNVTSIRTWVGQIRFFDQPMAWSPAPCFAPRQGALLASSAHDVN